MAHWRSETYKAIKKLVEVAKDESQFFEAYEIIHEKYSEVSEYAEAYGDLASGIILLGIVILGFNWFWDTLVATTNFGIAILLFVLSVAIVAVFYFAGKWRALREVHRVKPFGFHFNIIRGRRTRKK